MQEPATRPELPPPEPAPFAGKVRALPGCGNGTPALGASSFYLAHLLLARLLLAHLRSWSCRSRSQTAPPLTLQRPTAAELNERATTTTTTTARPFIPPGAFPNLRYHGPPRQRPADRAHTWMPGLRERRAAHVGHQRQHGQRARSDAKLPAGREPVPGHRLVAVERQPVRLWADAAKLPAGREPVPRHGLVAVERQPVRLCGAAAPTGRRPSTSTSSRTSARAARPERAHQESRSARPGATPLLGRAARVESGYRFVVHRRPRPRPRSSTRRSGPQEGEGEGRAFNRPHVNTDTHTLHTNHTRRPSRGCHHTTLTPCDLHVGQSQVGASCSFFPALTHVTGI